MTLSFDGFMVTPDVELGQVKLVPEPIVHRSKNKIHRRWWPFEPPNQVTINVSIYYVDNNF